ncbi:MULTISPECIES: TIGR03503 family protein [Pseudoalteromonas]|uniref:TIGR03503 family protein n=1 Tax=Pseudoalteromonas obscura TaxID=3048491 RepID=A0ABT7EIB6_9GAMM|nr:MULTISPECIES: TIGR03503 family protein [Pseudoalteromonas]MBQ4836421.1 TIGR03503 family protein [Pseudoalteromonas luteoviolacea]MDK2594771.1 TIGR03503 family protein [Pseudoalteromonas sp. P94(2023)]
MRICLAVLLIIVGWQAYAETPDITVLKRDGVSNEIPLLDNRFRIDHNVDKITLLFFRAPGAPAVVLVRPDGSKIYSIHAVKDEALEWYDEISYDLIIIDKPMPGPWQVLGQILKDSRIMVLGEIELAVEPLPPMLFRGEMLKVNGRVTNDGKPIDVGYFRDVVTLYVEFVSTNNEQYANFGAGTQSVTEFKDDGRDFDERPLDGVFTGEFKLVFPAGEWQPEFFIETPILKRRVVKDPIVIAEPPFSFELQLADDEEFEHELLIKLDREIVKPETVILQGKILYPNGEEQLFTLNEAERFYRQLQIKNYDWGRYSIQLSAFGENINGREFMAAIPDYNFEIERPIEKVPELTKPISPAELLGEPEPKEPETNTGLIVSIVLVGNLLVLLLGWLAIRVLVQKKPIKFSIPLPTSIPFLKKKPQMDIDELDEEEQKAADKDSDSGDVLNLSMSEDKR